MSLFPPVIRPKEAGEIRLPHPDLLYSPEYVQWLAKRVIIAQITFGYDLRLRNMSRRGLAHWADARLAKFPHTMSEWNGRKLHFNRLENALSVADLLVGNDESCWWLGRFLGFAKRKPAYIQNRDSVRLKIMLIALAVLASDAGF